MSHVVVVGAGVVGLCAADALVSRGFRVTILEREESPGEGCSYGNGGLVVPSHFEPLAAPGAIGAGLRMLCSRESPFGFAGRPSFEAAAWVARFARAGTRTHVERCAPLLRDLHLASRRLFECRFADVPAGYARRGGLMVCRTEATFAAERRLASHASRLGLAADVLDRAELERFETGIEVDAAGAVYFRDDAQITPSLFMSALRERVLSAGTTILDGAAAHGFLVRGGRVQAVRARDGEIEADEVVLAAGAWTGRLARDLGLRIPLLAGKGYGITATQPPATPKYPAILVDGRVAVAPRADGVRFVGTMELGPVGEASLNEARLRGLRRTIADAYPAFRDVDLTRLPVWAGLRPCSPDGMPYLGRPGKFENVVVAAGHGMMGMSLGPITGELVAKLVEGATPPIPLELLSPDRYA